MHAEEIKAAIRMKGTTPTALAEELGVSRSMMSLVINGNATSARIAARIASLIGKPVNVIWPAAEKKPTLRRDKPKSAARRAKATPATPAGAAA